MKKKLGKRIKGEESAQALHWIKLETSSSREQDVVVTVQNSTMKLSFSIGRGP